MLKNKIIVRKIRNIAILLMAIIIMIGAYKNIDKSRAEEVIEIGAVALDNYGYLDSEEFTLEAKEVETGLYEITLPETVNSKKTIQIMQVTADDQVLEIVDNKIQLTEEQKENATINVEVVYDVAILETNADGTYTKTLLSTKTEDELSQIQVTEQTETLYNKVLTFEAEEGKRVEVKGYLPENAELQIEAVTADTITSIFGDKEIAVAYDIEIIEKVQNEIPADEEVGETQTDVVVEILEVNPTEFGEICEVSITDTNITENSKVYHVKDDNTYEEIAVKTNTAQNVTFEASTFSIYAVEATITDTETDTSTDTEIGSDLDVEVDGDDSGVLAGAGSVEFSHYFPTSDNSLVSVSVVATGSPISAYLWSTSSTHPGFWSFTSETDYYLTMSRNTPGSWYLHILLVDGTVATSQKYVILEPAEEDTTDTTAPTPPVVDFAFETAAGEDAEYTEGTWINKQITLRMLSIDEDSGVVMMEYARDPDGTWTEFRFNGTGGTIYADEDGKYWGDAIMNTLDGNKEIYFRATDAAGNVSEVSEPYNLRLDLTKPTITVSPESASWRNSSLSVTITASDPTKYGSQGELATSGLSSSNSYQYYLSKSSSALSGGSWKTYTSGTAISLNPGTSGTYYLFVKRIKDIAGNTSTANGTATTISSVTYQRFGAYQFDYDEPTITVSPTSVDVCKTTNITITAADTGGSGLSSSNSYQYYLSESSGSLKGGSWKTYTSGTSFTEGTGLAGTYYLFVKQVSDAAGNVSTSNGTDTTISSTTYHMYGTYRFDNMPPEILVDEEVTDSAIRNFYAYNNTGSGYDSSATTWKDLSGNNDGTLNGGTWGNGYLSLDGTDDWVNFGQVYIDKGVTLEATIVMDSIKTDENSTIISNAETGGMQLFVNTSGRVRMSVYNATTSAYVYTENNSNVQLTTGQKYHILGTFDGNSMKLYIDGELKSTVAFSGTYGPPKYGTVMAIGTNPKGSNFDDYQTANIKVYSARVYDRALVESEIEKLGSGLLRSFDANNNTDSGHSSSTTTWKDLAGNHDGAITGGTWDDKYITLDGVDDWVNLGQVDFTATDQVTLEATVEYATAPSTATYILGNVDTGGAALYIDTYGNFTFQVYIDGAYSYARTTIAPTTNKKYHLVGTYDGATLIFYLNGELVVENAVSGEVGEPLKNTVMAIGGNPQGSIIQNGFSNMRVYSAKVYDRGLTADEVAANCNLGTPWAKEHTATVILNDSPAGLVASETVKYAWSTSNTTEPTSWEGTVTVSGHTAGSTIASTTITKTGLTGKYYLWVAPISLADTVGNTATAAVVSDKIYYFDNTNPTPPAVRMWLNSMGGTEYTSGNWTNQNVYAMMWSGGSDSHSGIYPRFYFCEPYRFN